MTKAADEWIGKRAAATGVQLRQPCVSKKPSRFPVLEPFVAFGVILLPLALVTRLKHRWLTANRDKARMRKVSGGMESGTQDEEEREEAPPTQHEIGRRPRMTEIPKEMTACHV